MSSFATNLAPENVPSTLKKAMKEVKSGNAGKAYEALIQYEEQLAGLPQYDYVLGLSALESSFSMGEEKIRRTSGVRSRAPRVSFRHPLPCVLLVGGSGHRGSAARR